MELGQFTWANLIAAIGLLFVGLSTLLGVWWSIEQRIRGVETKAKHDQANLATTSQAERIRIEKDAQTNLARVEKELSEFKLHVVEKYAPFEMVERSQKRLEDRIDLIANEVTKMPDMVVERIMRFLEFKKPSG